MIASKGCIIYNNCGGFESACSPLAGSARTIGRLRWHCILSLGDPAIDLLIARGDYAVGGGAYAYGWMQTIAGSSLKVSHDA